MDVFEKILALRPTNAVSRLGAASRLPVLNPRDLSRALGEGSALLCVSIAELSALPGVLRAAREVDAVLGLASPYSPLDRDAPYRFVDALQAAAAEVGHERPLFLQAGPVRLTGADSRALDQTKDHVFRYLDAGFSLLAIDGSRLSTEDNQRACYELSLAAMERELSVEVTAPRLDGGRTSPEALEAFLSQLAQANVRPNHVRVDARTAPSGTHARELDTELIAALVHTAAQYNVALTVEDAGDGNLSPLSAMGPLGVRKVDAVEALGKIAAKALPAQLRETLEQKARAAGIPMGEVLAQSDQFFRGASDAAMARVEAVSFAQTLDLLEAVGASGTARRAVSFLAEQAGY